MSLPYKLRKSTQIFHVAAWLLNLMINECLGREEAAVESCDEELIFIFLGISSRRTAWGCVLESFPKFHLFCSDNASACLSAIFA
mmetsp:Transcript_11243/g.13303  ORF Transcript_11243/g.13303 Transcript_11243/m.13303 type:complete len:85 (-) Transcript_11243:29-283(-)